MGRQSGGRPVTNNFRPVWTRTDLDDARRSDVVCLRNKITQNVAAEKDSADKLHVLCFDNAVMAYLYFQAARETDGLTGPVDVVPFSQLDAARFNPRLIRLFTLTCTRCGKLLYSMDAPGAYICRDCRVRYNLTGSN